MRKNEKRKKRARRTMKLQVKTVKNGSEEIDRLYAEADRHTILAADQIIAGTWQHPRTGLWQVWVSTAGIEVTWIGAYREKARATRAAATLETAWRRGDFASFDQAQRVLEQIVTEGDALPEEMREQEVIAITNHIRSMVLERKRSGSQNLEEEEQQL